MNSNKLILAGLAEKERIGSDPYKKIYERYSSSELKTSAKEKEKDVNAYKDALGQSRKVKASQRKGQVEVTTGVGGSIELSFFAKTRKNLDLLRGEIAYRQIKLPDRIRNEHKIEVVNDSILKLDEEPLKSMEKEAMKDVIRHDEYVAMSRKGSLPEGLREDKINAFKPQSQALIDSMGAFLSWKESKRK